MKRYAVRLALVAAVCWAGCGDEQDQPPGGMGGMGGSMMFSGSGGMPAGGVSGGAAGTPATAGSSGGGAAGATAGTGGAAPPKGAPTFTAIYKEILTVGAVGNCMFAGCHGAPPDPMANGNLTIMFGDQMGAYMNLFDKASTSPLCSGKKLVIPGDSANSLLIQKFSDAPPCGVKMPIGRPLTAAQVKQIADWIDMGAKYD